ncbi:FUSC family protein [Mycobacterium asiaticum]|uniref:Integral membrane bound transporter domain-containing protein n=1 Tax=Mycobacterium asiaticum TaxID=1790 RepID=A0A1A3N2B5_MYCAS|nr:FUSC family protein [Mycobacterium asiaticum]OBK14517.1 hypothetical protein A5636_07710 [Mycobacterium asiaticum]
MTLVFPASLTTRYERARTWTVGSDPGLLRLRLAVRTTFALGCSLLVMSALTSWARQPLTVALLGAVITMIAARSVNEPDPRQQRITMALLPMPAALASTAAAVLTPYRLASDIVFVVVVFIAVYLRRFGPRGRALGMVAFMAYFFTLFLHTGLHELAWMIVAILVGTLCTFVVTAYVLPDRPERVLRATIRSLRARMAIVVDTTAEVLRAGRLDRRRRRRLHTRISRLNETALMVQDQIEDKANPAALWLGDEGEQLTPWLFDAELAVEWVAIAGQRAALVVAQVPTGTRLALVGALSELAWAIRLPDSAGLGSAARQAQDVADAQPSPTGSDEPGVAAVRRLALAIIAAATATAEVRDLIERAAIGETPVKEPDGDGAPEEEERRRGLLPTTRQAIQASVAASLAIVTGDLVSPARWYWAVIAAFVVFAGTNTWGDTLTKGWQRLLGTVVGVPCGILVATLVAGDRTVSLIIIFACLFCAFYFMQVTQSLMAFWITTMLALLYGLLGQFSLDVLVLRIEETAIGAVVGVVVAILVLPTNIGETLRNDTREFLTALSELIDTSIATGFDDGRPDTPTDQARQLDRTLQQIRTTAKPLLAGVGGLAGRRDVQRRLRLFSACDRYARILARRSEQYRDPDCPEELADAVNAAAAQIRRNIDALIATLDGADETFVASAADALDAAESLAPAPGSYPSLLYPLRQIDRAIVASATHLDADAVIRGPATRS